MTVEQNAERLLRAIRCLQLIQRTNAPASSIAKAAAKALVPLLKEQAELPPRPYVIDSSQDPNAEPRVPPIVGTGGSGG